LANPKACVKTGIPFLATSTAPLNIRAIPRLPPAAEWIHDIIIDCLIIDVE
jgi:hypothetical protein